MTSEPHDWTVPAPLRALLWWPPVAFVVALLAPSAAAVTIAATGAVLAVFGVVGATVGAAVVRRLSAGPAGPADPTAAVPLAMTGADAAIASGQRAA